jgi:hypothetical protein
MATDPMGLESPEEYRYWMETFASWDEPTQQLLCERYHAIGSELDAAAMFCSQWDLDHPSTASRQQNLINDKWAANRAQREADEFSVLADAAGQTVHDYAALREQVVQEAGDQSVAIVHQAIPGAPVDPARQQLAETLGQGNTVAGEGGATFQNRLQADASDVAERAGEGATDLAITAAEGKAIEMAAAAGARSVRIGQQGERSAGLRTDRPRPRIDSITRPGRYRIPDELTEVSLREIKNVTRLSNTAQLRDFLAYSQQNGLTFILETRQRTRISRPLQNLIDQGLIEHRVIGAGP